MEKKEPDNFSLETSYYLPMLTKNYGTLDRF